MSPEITEELWTIRDRLGRLAADLSATNVAMARHIDCARDALADALNTHETKKEKPE